MPSLALEGGQQPADVFSDADPALVTLVAGFFSSRAGLPFLPNMPLVREFQLRQLRVSLPWMASVLGLPQPDGPLD